MQFLFTIATILTHRFNLAGTMGEASVFQDASKCCLLNAETLKLFAVISWFRLILSKGSLENSFFYRTEIDMRISLF